MSGALKYLLCLLVKDREKNARRFYLSVQNRVIGVSCRTVICRFLSYLSLNRLWTNSLKRNKRALSDCSCLPPHTTNSLSHSYKDHSRSRKSLHAVSEPVCKDFTLTNQRCSLLAKTIEASEKQSLVCRGSTLSSLSVRNSRLSAGM